MELEPSKGMVQDIFRSLWERRQELEIQNIEHYLIRSAKFKTFEFVRNKVNRQKHNEFQSMDCRTSSNCTEEQVLFNNLKAKVDDLVDTLPCQCKRGGTFDNSRWSYSVNTQNSFKVGGGYSFELNAYFNSKSAYGISTENYYWAVSTAMQKNVFGDKGSLKLLFNDIFQSSQYKIVTRYQNIDMNSHVNVDSRRLILSFSYRFGNQKLQKERKNGGDDILKRVKGGQ